MRCCICGEESNLIEEYTGAPHSLMSIFRTHEIQTREISLYQCKMCGHLSIPSHVDEEYYEDYSLGSYWGESFRRVRERQLERLKQLVPETGRFLDIGCGVGHYLSLAQKYFGELYGVEPSQTSAAIARQRGFSIINDYFHDGIQFEHDFDAISLIEVLEHLEQPTIVFNLAAQLLKDNGVMLVEVPNGQRIYDQCLYYNLSTDHIQYFSVSSLTRMAEQAGLMILCVQESEDPNLLEMYVRKTSRISVSFDSMRQTAIHRIVSQITNGTNIAAWGAGAEAASFLSMLNGVIPINCIIDSDTAKHGLKAAGIPIVPPTREIIQQLDTIILFANAHKKQIESQLVDAGFEGALICF